MGLLILFGLFPRETLLVALFPINLTLTIFNWTELVGHLPLYGVLAVLLIWGSGNSDPKLWSWGLRGVPPAVGTTGGGGPG